MEGCFVAGADPELMLVDAQGVLVSAIGIVPGTKEDPHPLTCGAVQHDNVLGEFNVNPSETSEELVHNFREVLRELSEMIAPLSLVARASAEYPKSALEDDVAKIFGCDPDFNAWTMMRNSVDGTAAMKRFRSAGGHFHVGMADSTREMLADPYGKVEVVKMMDIFMGIPSVLIDDDPTAPARRKLYGGAGAHRPKDYGVEYRALGNFWVRSPDLVELMYELANVAVSLTLDGKSSEIIEAVSEETAQQVINKSDRSVAGKIVENHLKKWIDSTIYQCLVSKSPIANIKGLTLKEAWGI